MRSIKNGKMHKKQLQKLDRNTFFVLAGEKSASIYGTQLIKQLRHERPEAIFRGTGGQDMVQEGLQEIVPFSNFQVMGITSVLFRFPKLIFSFKKIQDAILEHNPGTVIFIDQPALSLRLAYSLRKKGYRGKIVQYVAPTVWAYKENRIAELEKNFDLLLTLFPFEPAYFANTQLPCIFCGHPLVNILQREQKTDFKKCYTE